MTFQDFLSFANMVTIAAAAFYMGRLENRLSKLEEWREKMEVKISLPGQELR